MGNLDRGGRDDYRQRRALQRLVSNPQTAINAGGITLDPDGGLIFIGGNLSIKLDTDPGLSLGSGGLAFVPGNIPLDTLGSPTDTTDLNASTFTHGLLPKLPGDGTLYLDGTGAFTTPPVVVTLQKTVELDFGAASASFGVFTVTDADLVSGAIVSFGRSGDAATGRSADENEFAVMNIQTIQSVGSLSVTIDILDGRVSGLFKFKYTIIKP